MKPINCKIRSVVRVPLDENIEEERDLMLNSPMREREIEQWHDGILIEVQPTTSKVISEGYQNEQTTFYGMVWDSTDLMIKMLPLNEIRVEAKEMDRTMRKEWS